MSLRQLADAALHLPESDRAVLAAALLESLSPSPEQDTDDWDEEIRRRLEELDRGEVVAIPWEVAKRQIAGSIDEPEG